MIVESFKKDNIQNRMKRSMATYIFLYESLVSFSKEEKVVKLIVILSQRNKLETNYLSNENYTRESGFQT